MPKPKFVKEEEIERLLFSEDDFSDTEEVSEVIIEADRVFDDLHDALTWEEEEQQEVPQEEVEADALEEGVLGGAEQPSTSGATEATSPSLSLSELRSRKRRRGRLNPAEGASLQELPNKVYRAKDKTVWHSEPNPNLPPISRSDGIVEGAPTVATLSSSTPSECFELFMNDPLLAEVCMHSMDKITSLRDKFKRQASPTFRDVTLLELKALLGILIMSGARKDNHLTTEEMFSPILGCPFYRSVMSERRFSFLLRCLRFDDSATRKDRLKTDKFAAIRDFWNAVIRQCIGNYAPGPHLTVDEQLLAFRGRCSFRMYIPNKPAK